ncbi:hypothetical protein LCGC14_0571390 [marine sediment metagenome]|uniref:Uncharacterized protein n=1 Tax=marine sediment metagenome TaxID=412755 RepID=A0A0F9U5I3_9ZZZZ
MKIKEMTLQQLREYKNKRNRFYKKRNKKDHICFRCGKEVEPIRCPHCAEILKYKSRCNKCNDILNKRGKNDLAKEM